MRITLCIPIYNQLHDSKGPLGSLRFNTSNDTEWMIIDNASTDPVETFIRKYLKPKRLNYIRNKVNVGMVKSLQQAYENCETEILALTHNDVFVYEKNYDQRILSYFKKMPDLGGIGFFGSQGCGPIGERIQDVPERGICAGMSNMIEAEIHGMRLEEEWCSAAIFDGFFMAFRMKMLKQGNGFDQRYHFHHIYDRDASLESIRRGFKNIVVNVPCHHWCGMTANRSEYQKWIDKKVETQDHKGDKWTHDENSQLFKEKWAKALPLYVESDFSFRKGQYGNWNFKGDTIRRVK